MRSLHGFTGLEGSVRRSWNTRSPLKENVDSGGQLSTRKLLYIEIDRTGFSNLRAVEAAKASLFALGPNGHFNLPRSKIFDRGFSIVKAGKSGP